MYNYLLSRTIKAGIKCQIYSSIRISDFLNTSTKTFSNRLKEFIGLLKKMILCFKLYSKRFFTFRKYGKGEWN
jgi:hypothetical protein